MDMPINDAGYQKILERAISDKMVITSLIYENPGYLLVDFLNKLKSNIESLCNNTVEVDYYGSASTIFVRGETTPAEVQVAMCQTLAEAIKNDTVYTGGIEWCSYEYLSIMNIMTMNRIRTQGVTVCDAMADVMKYLQNPAELAGFFKIVTIEPGQVNIILA